MKHGIMQYSSVEDTDSDAWSSEQPLLSEVVTTPTGVCWRRIDPQSGDVCLIAEFEDPPLINEVLRVSDGYEVLVALRQRQASRENVVWVRVPSLGGWPPSLLDTRPLLARAMLELHRERSGNSGQEQRCRRRDAVRNTQVIRDGLYEHLTSADLLATSDWTEDLRVGEMQMDPGSWARSWPPSNAIIDARTRHEWGDGGCRWYERMYRSRTLRYFAYPDWGRLDLPIVIHTDHGWKGAYLGKFDVSFPVPVQGTLSGNYLLLCGNDGYGYRARLYELSSGNALWSSGRNSYASFWPVLPGQNGFTDFGQGLLST